MLEVKVAGLALKHPVMNASGILGSEPEHIELLVSYGVSAVVTKTITPEPREGNPPPIVVELRNGGLLNAIGLANPGTQALRSLAEKARSLEVPLIVSAGGKKIEDFVTVAEEAEKRGAAAVELNLSCPHTKGYGIEIGADPNAVYEVVKDVVSTLKIPVLAKLGLTDRVVEAAGKAIDAGARGLVLINTIKAMVVDVYALKPVLSNIYGGLSGPPIHPIAVRVVYDVYKEYGVDIIGSGGVSNWIDAAEFIIVGARAVQVGTALVLRPTTVFEILEGLRKWTSELGFKRIEDLVGAAHKT
ncbi:MAG: dihydroorotate dehydrogenase PyrD [Acidilobaceae archaeon]